MEKASNVNFLWFGAQPALSVYSSRLGVIGGGSFCYNSVLFVLLERGWIMGLMSLLLQMLPFSIISGFLLYNKWLIFKQCLLLGYISRVSMIKFDTCINICNIHLTFIDTILGTGDSMNKIDKVPSHGAYIFKCVLVVRS